MDRFVECFHCRHWHDEYKGKKFYCSYIEHYVSFYSQVCDRFEERTFSLDDLLENRKQREKKKLVDMNNDEIMKMMDESYCFAQCLLHFYATGVCLCDKDCMHKELEVPKK